MDVSKDSAVVLPIATASPVTSAAEQQQDHDDNQEQIQIHGIPPFRMRRGGIALPSVRYFVRVASGSIAC
jgi:hypothetical protein